MDLLQIWIPNMRVETENEAGASRLSQVSLSDADKSFGPWIMIDSFDAVTVFQYNI